LPIGAACAGDRVPDAPPNTGPSRPEHRCSTAVVTTLAADHAAALPHARSFPALGVLRRLRHDPMPTAGVTPAHQPAGGGLGRAAPGRFPRSLMPVSTEVGVQLYPGGIAAGRTSQSWPGPPAAQITQTTEADRSKATTCPAPQSDPSTRFSRSRTTHGASATGSVSLRLSVLAGGHEPSGSSGPPLRCRGCSRPHP
jgi:hypothetical protein